MCPPLVTEIDNSQNHETLSDEIDIDDNNMSMVTLTTLLQ